MPHYHHRSGKMDTNHQMERSLDHWFQTKFKECYIRPGIVARIPAFHPGGPGSIPGVGIFFCLVEPLSFEIVCMHFVLP